MTILIFAAAYFVGWVYGARLSLASMMSVLVCPEGGDTEWLCRRYHHGKHRPVPVGQMRDRRPRDAVDAMFVGLFWPIVVVAYLLLKTTPRTPGETVRLMAEQERRISEQHEQIQRLTRQVGGTGGA